MEPMELLRIGIENKDYPQFLYKYREDNKHTEKIIKNNELWFSSPLLFNDPYDCNIPVDLNNSLEEIKEWLISVKDDPQSVDDNASELKKNPNLMKENVEKEMGGIGICCFSALDDSILQWSHYAHYHKGICFKFDITDDPDFFMTPVNVSYSEEMQHYNHYRDKNNIVPILIKPKFNGWCYENEVRIVKTKENIIKNGCNRAFKYKDIALKEVIFGTKTSERTITKFKKLCIKYNKSHVQFFKMKLGSESHYQLIKEQI